MTNVEMNKKAKAMIKRRFESLFELMEKIEQKGMTETDSVCFKSMYFECSDYLNFARDLEIVDDDYYENWKIELDTMFRSYFDYSRNGGK